MDQWMVMVVHRLVHHFGPDRNISTTTEWIALQFCTDIHASQTMNTTTTRFTYDIPIGLSCTLCVVPISKC